VTQATELQRVWSENKDNSARHERALATRLGGANVSKWYTATTSPCLKGIIIKRIAFFGKKTLVSYKYKICFICNHSADRLLK